MPPCRELKNIPVSISILHEQEYNNLCLILRSSKNKIKKRRAFSDKSNDKSDDSDNEIIQIKINKPRRKTLKN
jgi:hypothetical protein